MSGSKDETAEPSTEGAGGETPETDVGPTALDPETAAPETEGADSATSPTEGAGGEAPETDAAPTTEAPETAEPETGGLAINAAPETEGPDSAAPATEGADTAVAPTEGASGEAPEADATVTKSSDVKETSAPENVKSPVSETIKPLKETSNTQADAMKHDPVAYNPSCRCRDCPVLEAARAMIAREAEEKGLTGGETPDIQKEPITDSLIPPAGDQTAMLQSDQTAELQADQTVESQINERTDSQIMTPIPDAQPDQLNEPEVPTTIELPQNGDKVLNATPEVDDAAPENVENAIISEQTDDATEAIVSKQTSDDVKQATQNSDNNEETPVE